MDTKYTIWAILFMVCQSLNAAPFENNSNPPFNPPNAEAGSSAEIDCDNQTLQLDGSASSQGIHIQYLWTTNQGNIISAPDSIMATIDSPGWYYLTVTDTLNDCFSVDSVEITQHADVPFVYVSMPDTVSCLQPQIILDGSISLQGLGIARYWVTAQGGNIAADEHLYTPTIDAGGLYTLIVTNNNVGCSGSYTVEVFEDDEGKPIVEAGTTQAVCHGGSLQLNGSFQADGNNNQISWQTLDGDIANGASTLNPEIEQPGTYYLTIIDEDTNCQGVDSVEITLFDYPSINIATPATITCDDPMITLDGSNSSDNDEIRVSWATLDGNIQGSTNDFIVNIDLAGTYTLEIADTVANCSITETVTVIGNADLPVIEAGDTMTLTCNDPTLTLNASGPSGADIQYEWETLNGNILSGDQTLNPIVDQAGIYELTVWNTVTDCESVDTIIILENLKVPTAEAGLDHHLTCTNTLATLDGSNSSTGSEISYQWQTQNGNFVSMTNTLISSADEPGQYTLLVTNITNGCTAIDEVTVTQDISIPLTQIEEPADFTCATSFVQLDGSASSSGANIQYVWTDSDGTVINGNGSPTQTIGSPGTYTLTVLDSSNDCESSDEVMVEIDTISPILQIVEPDLVNCVNTEVTLDASNSSQGTGFIFQWTTQSGNIVTGSDSPMATVDQAGIYELTIINTQNGCSVTATEKVEESFETTSANIETPDLLTCFSAFVELDATGSSQGPNINYFWETDTGNIVPGGDILMLQASAPGTYEIFVVHSESGCSSSASVQVFADLEDPLSEAGTGGYVDCSIPSILLDGTNSSQGIEFDYEWITFDGTIVSGDASLNPEISSPGIYYLKVTNSQNGCTAIDQVEVSGSLESPLLEINDPDILTCAIGQIELNASNSSQGAEFIYEWTTSDGNILSGLNTLFPQIDAPGNYTLSILDTQNSCTSEGQIVVTQDIEPPIVDAGQPFVLGCDQSVYNLTGTIQNVQNPSFLWTTMDGNIVSGETTSNPLIDVEGTYTFSVTNNQNGCEASDEVTVTVDSPIDFEYEIELPDCENPFGKVLVKKVSGGVPPYEYSNDDGATFQSTALFDNLYPGTYFLVVQDANKCILESKIEIPDLEPIEITLEPEYVVEFGDEMILDPQLNIPESSIAEVVWSPASGLECPECLSTNFFGLRNSKYSLEIIDVNGCSAYTEVEIFVHQNFAVYIPNAFSPNNDGVNDVFSISAKPGVVSQVKSFSIFDRWGAQIYTAQNFQPNDISFGWDGLKNGQKLDGEVFIYFAEIEFVDGLVEVFKGDVMLVR